MIRPYVLLLAAALLMTAGCSATALDRLRPSPASMDVAETVTAPNIADSPMAGQLPVTAPTLRQPSGAAAVPASAHGVTAPGSTEIDRGEDSPLARPHRLSPPDVSRQQAVAMQTVDRLHRNDTLTQDTHWQGVVLVEGALTVPGHVTLTVAPGTVVRFRPDTSGNAAVPGVLVVEGRLAVNGTADRPVAFLPAMAPPLPGNWQGIVLLGSDKRNSLEHCRIEGAETGLDLLHAAASLKGVAISACDTGMHLQESVVTLQETSFSDTLAAVEAIASELEMKESRLTTGVTGILATTSSLFLSGCTISGQRRYGAAAADSRVLIQRTAFNGNGSGLHLQGGEGSIADSRFTGNTEDGLQLSAARIRVTGSDFFRNGRSGLVTEDGLAAAWNCSFRGNGLYDLEHRGSDDLRAMNNWWQAPQAGTAAVGGAVSLGGGRVLTAPPLGRRPAGSEQP